MSFIIEEDSPNTSTKALGRFVVEESGEPAPKHLARNIGLTGRGLVEGAASTITLPIDLGMMAGRKLVGLAAKAAGLPDEDRDYTNSSDLTKKTLTELGLPKPDSAGERLYTDLVGAVGGVASLKKLGEMALRSAPKGAASGQSLARLVTTNVPEQYAAAIGAAGAGGVAREVGLPWYAQIPAAMVGGSIYPVSANISKAGANLLKDKVGDVYDATLATAGNKSAIENMAGKKLRYLAGDQSDKLARAVDYGGAEIMRGVRPDVTQRIAAYNTTSQDQIGSGIAALQAKLERDSATRDIFETAKKQNISAMSEPFERIAKGGSIDDIDDAIGKQIARREAITSPMRDKALSTLRPIDDRPLTFQMKKILGTPGQGGELKRTLFKGITDELSELKELRNGVLTARDLDEFRRSGVNNLIEKLLQGSSDSVKRDAARVVNQLKPTIIKMIEDAGGKGYGDYLRRYSGLRGYENQMSGAGAVLQKIRNEVGKESVAPLLRSLGPGEENLARSVKKGAQGLEDVFTPNQMKNYVKPLTAEVERMSAAENLKQGSIGKIGVDLAKSPNTLDVRFSLLNKALGIIGANATSPIEKRLAQILANEPDTFKAMISSKSKDPASILARDWWRKATVGAGLFAGGEF